MLWSQETHYGDGQAGISWLVATEQFTAFVWAVPGEYAIYTGGPRGENLRPDPLFQMIAARDIESMHADGAHMVIEASGDIYLYTRRNDSTSTRTGSLENLTPLPSLQFDPWVSGRYVVWTDQRHGVRGTATALDNTEVYLYDIETRTMRRLTNDPPERPVIQLNARVEGDWVVWLDQRNSPMPNQYPDTQPEVPREVYGYHIPTGREVPLITGRNLVTDPVLVGGDLWYNCAGNLRTDEQFEGTYRVHMPAAPSP